MTVRKLANWLLYPAAICVAALIAGVIIASKPLPDGTMGERAEAMADSLLEAVNINAWESLRYVKWTYRGRRHYVWDRWYNLAEIRWDDNRVLIHLNTLEGKAWDSGILLSGDEKRALVQKGWELWCNDSFWFNPVVKIRDEGTQRRCVDLPNGESGLLVTYTKGGVTPGDSYLWITDGSGMPVACRMWVSALPIKGIRFTWEDWINLEGARVALTHRAGPVTIRITDAASGDHHTDIGLERDPFTDF